MSPAAERRLAELRTGLLFAGKAHRPAIAAMIAELLAEQTAGPATGSDPVKGDVGFPEKCNGSAPPPAATATRHNGGEEAAVAVPPPPAATKAAPAIPTAAPCAPPGPGGAAGAAAAPGSAAPVSAISADPRVARDVPMGESWAFREHRSQAEILRQERRALASLRSGQANAERSARARAIDRPPAAAGPDMPAGDRRQPPLPRRSFVLGWDAAVVIRPPRPAPLKRYRSGPRAGAPTPFQDDLNAIADHGSPGAIDREAMFGRSATGSTLGGAWL